MTVKKQKTILLVEDDAITAMKESKALGKKGYHVVHVINGDKAIKTIFDDKTEIDLILMDIDLGSGKDGTETAEIILKEKEIPIVFLSSHTELEIVEKTERITSYGYVVKDSGITILDASIKMAFKLFEANRAIRTKETLLLSMAENYPNSYVSIIEADYTVGFTSGQEFKNLNLDPDKFIGQTLEQIFGDQVDIVREYYEKTFIGEECSFELFINGQHQYFRTVPLYSEEGSINQILAVVENVTERKYAEEALLRERDFAESLIETAQTIIMVLDVNGRIVRFNPYMQELSGYHLDEVKGKDWFETFLPPSDYDDIRAVFKGAIGDIQTQGNVNPILTSDGKEIFVEWHDKTLKDAQGNIIGLLAVGQDITDRMRTEDAMRESEEKYSALVEQSQDGVLIIQDGIIKFANYTTGVISGYPLEELIEKPFIGFISPGSKEIVGERYKSRINRKKAPNIYEAKIKCKDGTDKDVEITAGVIQYKGNKAVMGTIRDITRRREVVDELGKALQENKDLLRELQHRAKNSFMMICSMIDLVAESNEFDEAKKALFEVGTRIRAVSELYDLLNTSNSITSVRLDEYCSRVIDYLKNITENVVFKNTFDVVTAPVKTAIPVGIIITELITNSIKHAFPDSKNGTVELIMKKTKTGAVIKINDNGIGLPEGFNILDVNSMGLKLVSVLVQQIEGSFKIESRDGTWSIVEFPIE